MGKQLIPYPEALRRGDVPSSIWQVEGGTATRGDAYTDFTSHVLRVPFHDTPEARLVRAHELVHAKVSPTEDTETTRLMVSEFGARTLECAEEYRVNTLVDRAGFDTALLSDGSEGKSGDMMSREDTREAWRELVNFAAACAGTGAQKPLIAGVKKNNPEWAKLLSQMCRDLAKRANGISTEKLASTEIIDDTPEGYARYTRDFARVIANYAGADPDADMVNKALARASNPGSRRPATGEWAALVWGKTEPDVTSQKQDKLGRKKVASVSGRRLAYPSRLLTDPERRIFARASVGRGGVIVIDMSGSMDVSAEQIEALLKALPSATIVGYSHKPGNLGGMANAWVLAKGGKRAAVLPQGNVGNGCDYPIIQWATRERIASEPVVWVCDGQTTDSNDHPLVTADLVKLVVRHKVHMVSDVDSLIGELRAGGRQALMTAQHSGGRIGKELLRLGYRIKKQKGRW